MAYREISDPQRIAALSEQLVRALGQGARAAETPGGVALVQPAWAFWTTAHSRLLEKKDTWRRTVPRRIVTELAVGTLPADDATTEAPLVPLAVLSFLPRTFKRRRELVFVEDAGGRVHLAHRGYVKIPPRPRKQGRDTYLDPAKFGGDSFERTGPFGQARHPVIVIGALDDEHFVERFAHFAHELAHYLHGGPTGAERMDALQKDRSWTGRAFSLFRRG